MNKVTRFLCVLLYASLVACGGGGSGSTPPPGSSPPPPPPPPPPSGGIGRTGLAFGPITTFGSIVVNGVRYDTSSAVFTVNDDIGSEDDLRVGYVVALKGTINDDDITGSADEVFYDDLVKGPVDSVDPATDSLVVLGQTVLTNAETSFDNRFSPASIEGITAGQLVEVTGHIMASGEIVATRIEPKPPGTIFEVHGTVSSLDTANSTFSLNALVVDFSAASLDDFPNGQISDGDFVEAKGSALGAGGELLASRVELEALIPDADEGDHVEIEGFITRFDSAEDFDVVGRPVTTTASTVFEGGSAADLGLNIKVEVEGQLDADGVLVAEKVDIRRASAVRVTTTLDSVDADNNQVTMLGFTVTIDALTRMEDKSDAELEPLTIADLNAGEYVEVRGAEMPASSGNLLASILEREDPDTEAILQGFVESVADPAFTILGVTIETGPGTVFRDEFETAMTSAEFFNRLATGDLVKAKGLESASSTITAEEVEFESEF